MTGKIKNVFVFVFSLCLVLCLCVTVFAETDVNNENFGSIEIPSEVASTEASVNTSEEVQIPTEVVSEESSEVQQPSEVITEGESSIVTEPSTSLGGFSGIVSIKPIVTTTAATTVVTETETENQWQEQPESTAANDSNSNNDNNDDNKKPVHQEDKTTTLPVEETTEEESLPEGSYYLYLERNNGERRLKLLMTGTGYVTVPDNPVREGFTFAGWFADPEFKKAWDFYRDKASETMTFYAKWEKNPETVIHKITVEKLKHGKIEVNPSEASEGEIVSINVTPDKGKRLVPGSLKINGEAIDLFTFTMPADDVKISALFENAPKASNAEEKNNMIPFIIIAVILFVIVAVVAVMVIKRRNDFDPDYDPDNPDIDDDDEDVWIDESIVVEDAFQDGVKKINEDFIPDFGTPEDDDED